MRKLILTSLTFTSIVFGTESCHILTEPTIATYSQDTLAKIQSNKDLADDALRNGLAVELKVGTQFCDTTDHNWTWYRKRIQLKPTGASLWIIDTVKTDKL
ncbi:hypothetical protein [Sulfuricurvum sp.]|uniref:hypothetical protein n=1 Tax=Sulfuricurvum sp. TaxID=2025608 RepID=UPI00262C4DF5|nr:hypothetical protein [Sulfuricurvum sp.]MDD3596993.1 hypothetical protein [Sulfuricurvum sp.]